MAVVDKYAIFCPLLLQYDGGFPKEKKYLELDLGPIFLEVFLLCL